MKLYAIVLAFAIWGSSGTLHAAQSAADDAALAAAPRVTLNEFKKLCESDAAVIIDVREPQKYAEGHIPGALSIPLETIMSRVPELKKETKPILVYCA